MSRPEFRGRCGLLAAGALVGLVGCGEDIITGSICQPVSGIVARILDGDTIELDTQEKVRYLLVDTPETGDTPGGEAKDCSLIGTTAPNECFAEEAWELNCQLVQGREVALEYDQGQCTGSLGRALAYVYVDNRLVNQILVERGYARVSNEHPSNHPSDYLREAEFLELEAKAQELHRGRWGVCP